MKKTNEIINHIIKTFGKAGSPLSVDQEVVLSGCLHVWIDKIKEDQIKECAEIVLKEICKNENQHN